MNKIRIGANLIVSDNDINVDELKEKLNDVIKSFIKEDTKVYVNNLCVNSNNNYDVDSSGKFHVGDIYKISEEVYIHKNKSVIEEYFILIINICFQVNDQTHIHVYKSTNGLSINGKNYIIDDIIFDNYSLGYNIQNDTINSYTHKVVKHEFVKRVDDNIMDNILLDYYMSC